MKTLLLLMALSVSGCHDEAHQNLSNELWSLRKEQEYHLKLIRFYSVKPELDAMCTWYAKVSHLNHSWVGEPGRETEPTCQVYNVNDFEKTHDEVPISFIRRIKKKLDQK